MKKNQFKQKPQNEPLQFPMNPYYKASKKKGFDFLAFKIRLKRKPKKVQFPEIEQTSDEFLQKFMNPYQK